MLASGGTVVEGLHRERSREDKSAPCSCHSTHGAYHLANCQPMHHTASIIIHIVDRGTLARVERNTESPLLPLDKRLIGDTERGAFRLHHIQRLEVLAGSLGKEFWYVFRGLAVADDVPLEGLFQQPFSLATGSRTVDPDNLLGVCVHHGDDGKGERIEVGICVTRALVLGEAETLEVAPVFIGKIQTAIGPGFDDDFEAGRQVEVCDGLLEEGGVHAAVDQGVEFAPTRELAKLS